MGYLLGPDLTLLAGWYSDHGWGGGLRLSFKGGSTQYGGNENGGAWHIPTKITRP